MGNQFLLSLAVALSVASTASATFISPFSTESLSWSTPSNLTINQFDAKHPLLLPLQESIILRVFSSPSCAAIDSDPARKMWWAEVRRHVAHENALALGNVAVSDLPRGLDAAMFGLVDAAQCSGIAYLPFGFDGTGPRPEQKHVAPPDSHGMPAFVAWASSSLRTFCTVTNLLDRDLTLFWVDDSLDLKKLTQVGAGESVPQNTFVGHAYVAKDASTLAVVDWWAMDGSPSHVISDKAALLAHSCQAPVAAGAKEMAKELKLGEDSGHGGCASGKPFDPEQSLFDFLYDSSMVKRYALNTVQPTVVHNYSATGYAVLPLPPHTYEWLRKWYHDNAAREIVEGSAGAVGTQHKAPWYVRHISHHLKQRLITELRPMLAEWSGYEDDALEVWGRQKSLREESIDQQTVERNDNEKPSPSCHL